MAWRQYPDEKVWEPRSPVHDSTPKQPTDFAPFAFATESQAERRAASNERRKEQEEIANEYHKFLETRMKSTLKTSAEIVAAQVANTARHQRNENATPLLHVEVIVGPGRTETLKLWPTCDAEDVAREFATMHKLPEDAAANLSENLRLHMTRAAMASAASRSDST